MKYKHQVKIMTLADLCDLTSSHMNDFIAATIFLYFQLYPMCMCYKAE